MPGITPIIPDVLFSRSLNPGRYVGVVEEKDDGLDFKERLEELNDELEKLNKEAKELEKQGFSPRNLKYMRAIAEAYPDNQIVQQLVAQIPWGHNVRIPDYVKNYQERLRR